MRAIQMAGDGLRARTRQCAVAAALLIAAGCRDNGGDEAAGTDDGGDDAATSMGSGDSAGSDSGGPMLDVTPPAGGMRRLLAHQYLSSIEMLLGPEAAAAALPPHDGSVGGFDSVAATELALPPSAIEGYEKSALVVADAAAANPQRIAATVPCVVDGPTNDTCYGALARDLGRLLWRRPLTDAEVDGVVELAKAGRAWPEGDGFATGVKYALLAMLQSPNFVYIVEVGVDDGSGQRDLTQYELATRLSFFLAGHTPTAELLDAAEAGELGSQDQLRSAARSLLADPGAPQQVGRFYAELFELRDLEDKGKDTDLFPVWDEQTAASMREETLRLVEHVVFEQNSDVLEVFDADYTFVNDRLAVIYKLPAPGGWAQVTPRRKEDRAGILTHPSFLATMSYTTRNSPTRRGLFIQDKLLCQKVPPPPPDVNPVLPDLGPDVTLRQRLEAHMEADGCAQCHGLTDPLGFAFEHFDAVGQFRKLDNGLPIDASGDVAGLGSWGNAEEIAALLRDDPRVPSCMLKNVFAHALGVHPRKAQAEAFEALDVVFADLEHNLQEVLIHMAISPLFTRVEEPK